MAERFVWACLCGGQWSGTLHGRDRAVLQAGWERIHTLPGCAPTSPAVAARARRAADAMVARELGR